MCTNSTSFIHYQIKDKKFKNPNFFNKEKKLNELFEKRNILHMIEKRKITSKEERKEKVKNRRKDKHKRKGKDKHKRKKIEERIKQQQKWRKNPNDQRNIEEKDRKALNISLGNFIHNIFRHFYLCFRSQFNWLNFGELGEKTVGALYFFSLSSLPTKYTNDPFSLSYFLFSLFSIQPNKLLFFIHSISPSTKNALSPKSRVSWRKIWVKIFYFFYYF